ncbi:hypothetical protein ACOZ06_002049 [Cronobacter muytjensii]|uniref:hypothetical protein n=1 Tax=Cronobacter muytjensii TaxID=413501 RepID=UPI001CD9F5D0|nr:hypothetical protein [Cronobacter muytjensii]MDI6457432.1 hypothetical protein [Cronobacter muytjensii]MEB8640769.1 hypothetical protein [Cronobacter muytjensii]
MNDSSASGFSLAKAAPEHDKITSGITLPLVNKIPLPRDDSMGMVGFPGWQRLVKGKKRFPEFRKRVSDFFSAASFILIFLKRLGMAVSDLNFRYE